MTKLFEGDAYLKEFKANIIKIVKEDNYIIYKIICSTFVLIYSE